MDSHVTGDDRSVVWTNEKHVNFLKMMEASFVRTMLENEDGRSKLTYATARNAPLDRYLPDSSESTRDLKHRRYTRKSSHTYFPEVTDRRIINGTRNEERKTRRRYSRPHDSSQDQVVPQYKRADKDDESGKLIVAVAPDHDRD